MNPTSRRLCRRGTSLLELLIYCGLLSIALTISNYLAVGSVRFIHQADAGSTVQQHAATSMTELSAELAESDYSSVGGSGSVYSGVPYVMFASPRSANGNDLITGPMTYSGTSLVWKTWVCYYLDTSASTTRLMRQIATIPTTQTTPPTNFPTLAQMSGLSGSSLRVLATNVLPLTDPVSGTANDGASGHTSPGLWVSTDSSSHLATISLTFYDYDINANSLQVQTKVLLRN